MSDTPRTDSQHTITCEGSLGQIETGVDIDFARTLERELNTRAESAQVGDAVELKAQLDRAFAVIKDHSNVTQVIAELLSSASEGNAITGLVINQDGNPYELRPQDTQYLAGRLYTWMVERCGVTAKIEKISDENNRLTAELQRLREVEKAADKLMDSHTTFGVCFNDEIEALKASLGKEGA